MISISDFLALVASLVTIGAGAAVVIRYFQQKRAHQPLVIWGTLATVTIIVIAAVVLSRITTITVAGSPSILIPGLGSTSSPTATSFTQTPQATLIPPPNSSTPTLLGSGTITLNHPLACGGCDEPIIPIVSSVAVNDASDNSIWTLTFYNHSGATCDVTHLSMDLSDPQGHDYVAAGGVTGGVSGDIKPNQSVQGTTTFAFVPYRGVTYTVSAYMNLYCYSYNHSNNEYADTLTF